jgi:hypothetical protein
MGTAAAGGWFGWILAGVFAFFTLGYWANLTTTKEKMAEREQQAKLRKEEKKKEKEAELALRVALQLARHENEEDDDAESEGRRKIPKSEWFPDWKETLGAFLGRKFSKSEEEAYRELFGGDNECRFNLRMFMSRAGRGAICLHAPPDDYYRARYETLVDTGAVLSGKNIPPAYRVMALSMQEMRALATAMNLPKSRSKQALADAAVTAGDDAIEATWESTGVDIDDLFLFDAEAVKSMV